MAKRHHQMKLKPNIEGITKPAIRRLCRRGGVKRISGLVYEETRGALRTFLEEILRLSVELATHDKKRMTVKVTDVIYALKFHGRTMYGFDECNMSYPRKEKPAPPPRLRLPPGPLSSPRTTRLPSRPLSSPRTTRLPSGPLSSLRTKPLPSEPLSSPRNTPLPPGPPPQTRLPPGPPPRARGPPAYAPHASSRSGGIAHHPPQGP